MSEGIRLTENMEDYLEMFFRIVEDQGYVRSVDLSNAVKVQPSSVTRMVKKLDEAGYIAYQKYRNLALTDKGYRYGRYLAWRDDTLKEFFRLLKVEVGIEEQVEGIEHYITPPTMKLFQRLIIYFNTKPERLIELENLRNQHFYPGNEELLKLRAWLFRHDNS